MRAFSFITTTITSPFIIDSMSLIIDNEKVDIQDLIGSLQKGGQYAGLKKKLVF